MNNENKVPKTLLVAAGGTGGHLFPALAVVEALESLGNTNKFKFIFTGTPDRMESKILPGLGYNYYPLPITGFKGIFSLQSYILPIKIIWSINRCIGIIKKHDCKALIAAGAYLSYPPAIAASLCGIPVFLIESNVHPGKTNKILSRRAKIIFTSYDESAEHFPKEVRSKLKAYGNPLRNTFGNLPERSRALQNFGLDDGRKTVLIFGGSLGARSINNAVKQSISGIESSKYQILWQTGNSFEKTGKLPDNIILLHFIDDMASAYSAADLVVCRSGGTTVAELAALGKPSVLIPLPTAANDEQSSNGKILASHGAACIVKDSEILEKLFPLIDELIFDEVRLSDMANAAKELGKPDAAKNIAKEIIKFLYLKNYS
ncbi:MAG: murG [Ignavibacteria bacterium]|nr:murG [Ignavibacteria bacterium]